MFLQYIARDLDLIITLRERDLAENLSHSPHCLKSHLLLDKNMKHVYFWHPSYRLCLVVIVLICHLAGNLSTNNKSLPEIDWKPLIPDCHHATYSMKPPWGKWDFNLQFNENYCPCLFQYFKRHRGDHLCHITCMKRLEGL